MQDQQHYDINLSRINSCSSSLSMVRLISCNSTNQQQIYRKINQKLLHTSDVYKQIERIVAEISDQITLDGDLVLLLLHENRWDEGKSVNKYFDVDNVRYQTIKDAKARHCLLPREQTCPVCEELRDVYESYCGHACCKDCWIRHIQEELREGRAFVKCVDYQCRQIVLHSFIKALVTDQKNYIRTLSREYVSQTKSLRFCPGVDCEYCFQDLSLICKNVVCKCGTRFCFKCGKQPHQPCSCPQAQKWFILTKNQKSNEVWIKIHTKLCPTCKNTIERTFGCNYMVCTCGQIFCYNCSCKWDQSHTSHFDCPFKQIQKKPLQKRQNDAVKITEMYDNFLLHSSIQKRTTAEMRNIAQLREEIRQRLHVPEYESQFLQNAFDKVLENRSILKWAEVMQYFHREDANYELREFSLGEFRRELERCGVALSEFIRGVRLLVSRQRNLLQTNNTADFYKQRDTLLKSLNQTDNYVKRFLQQLQK